VEPAAQEEESKGEDAMDEMADFFGDLDESCKPTSTKDTTLNSSVPASLPKALKESDVSLGEQVDSHHEE
jgi:hypothetical protein